MIMETNETKKTYKLKTTTGVTFRDLFSDFEIRALKYADEENLETGTDFVFGNSNEIFNVKENSDEYICIFREKVSKDINANKVYSGEKNTKKQTQQEQPTETGEETETKKYKPMEQKETSTKEKQQSNANNDIAAAFANLQNALLSNQPTSNIDMEEVKKLIVEEVEKVHTTNIKINDVPTFETEGTLHDKFGDVLSWVMQNEPVYLFGAAGTGKNVLSEQVAEAMKLPFYYAGCLQQKYELEGFINASGEYQETEFYKAFTSGGVFLFDEIDGTAAEVLIAFNAALANRYYNFPKYGKVKAHKDFHVIAAGNTTGRGADETYNGRFQLDASTLDRFVFIGLDYNEKIELQNANGDRELVAFAHMLRKEIIKQGLTYTFSTRAIKRITIAKAMGMDISKSLQQSLCGGWAKEDIVLLQNSLLSSPNIYAKEFCKLKQF